MDNKYEFIKRIKLRRKELGLSYQGLADRTGMGKSTLQQYEAGTIKNLPVSKLGILAEALETTQIYLLGLENEITEDMVRENRINGGAIMPNPKIVIPEDIKNTIQELYNTAKRIDLGNVSFKYSNNGGYDEITVCIDEYKEHWECNIVTYKYENSVQRRILDMYHINDEGLHYKESEID